jgi:hypothetical protein
MMPRKSKMVTMKRSLLNKTMRTIKEQQSLINRLFAQNEKLWAERGSLPLIGKNEPKDSSWVH